MQCPPQAAVTTFGAWPDDRWHWVHATQWCDGTVRDVVVFSIIASEWPTVRLALMEKLRTRTTV